MMLTRKSEKKPDEKLENQDDAKERDDQVEDGASPLPLRPQGRPMPSPARAVGNPEIVRRTPDIPSAGPRRPETAVTPEKKLIVGREIVLSGQIKACDHLVVEGRVEANIADCRVIDIAESGTFKGEAEIDFADISGNFEGSITASDLLLVRSTGRVTGNVRFGQLEIERGGQIVGDVQTVAAGGLKAAPKPADSTAAE